MADVKISGLPASTTPLAGTEVLPIVQSGVTKQVTNNDLRPKQIQSNATTGVLQVAGPGSASTRVMTTPDANFTVARTDAGNAFTGNQTISGLLTAGGAAVTGYQHRFTGSTSAISGANSFGVVVDNTIAPPVGGYNATNAYIAGTLTMPATGALNDAAGLWLAAPVLNGTGTAPRATTFRISGAPTGATLNRAVWVQGGFVEFDGGVSIGNAVDKGNGSLNVSGLIYPQQAVTASAPAYVKGAIYFDTTLNKLRVGGATAWETITSV